MGFSLQRKFIPRPRNSFSGNLCSVVGQYSTLPDPSAESDARRTEKMAAGPASNLII